MKVLYKQKVKGVFQQYGSVNALWIQTRSGAFDIVEGEFGIEITPAEPGSRLCIVPRDGTGIEVLTLHHGYEIMHESESDGG